MRSRLGALTLGALLFTSLVTPSVGNAVGLTASPPNILYVVDTVSDDPGLSACTTGAGDCSLRGAVAAANSSAGYDAIHFDIPAGSCPGGVCTITLTGGPLSIDEATLVDGTTQPQNGAPQANVCATPTEPSFMRIQIITDPTTGLKDGFSINSPTAVTIKGLAIGTNTGPPGFTRAIRVTTGSGHAIQCNHLGVDAAGTAPLGTGQFSANVAIEGDASEVVVGTDGDGTGDLAERNVMGVSAYGVYVNSNDHNYISGNYVGVGADGVADVGAPGAWGVYLRQSSDNNLIGSDLDGISDDLEGNLIANYGYGVLIDGASGVVGNDIAGNIIGMTADGTGAHVGTGIYLKDLTATSSNNTIEGNVFGQGSAGIRVGAADTMVTVRRNVVGSNRSGTVLYPVVGGIQLEGSGTYQVSSNAVRNASAFGIQISGTATVGFGSWNCIESNANGVQNLTGVPVDLTLNWWGDASGPSGFGPGSGDWVSANVTFDPWLFYPPVSCHFLTVRVAGLDRFATAVEVSKYADPGAMASTVFVANGLNYPDALAGGAVGVPVLLVRPDSIPAVTADELTRRAPSEIVVLGGEAAVSSAVKTSLGAYAPTVRRLAGPDRFATAAAISADYWASAGVVYLAYGLNFPDALAGVPAALPEGAPLLLTRTDTVPPVTANELTRLSPTEVVLLGGTGVISDAVRTQVETLLPGVTATRLAGASRFGTAAAVSQRMYSGRADVVFVANGLGFPDALAGGPAADMEGAPLLLVRTDSIPPETEAEILRLAPQRIVILGGTGVVSDTVATQLEALIGP